MAERQIELGLALPGKQCGPEECIVYWIGLHSAGVSRDGRACVLELICCIWCTERVKLKFLITIYPLALVPYKAFVIELLWIYTASYLCQL